MCIRSRHSQGKSQSSICGRTTERWISKIHTPGIKMGVKVQDRNRSAIDLVKCSEGWKGNAMIATQC